MSPKPHAPIAALAAAPAPDRGTHHPRTLLVGTSLTLAQLRHALETVEPRPTIVGELVACDDLEAVLADEAVEQVLVSLPVARASEVRAIGTRCERAGVRWRFLPTLADQLAGRL